ncbi:unnamed protein product [Vicia faba]|uniref:Uncharacterized protein n=1 Tax=Vicia faba TaxID=3906 RepID=A0AAV0Z8Z4_VICFA|nr:unnamed protein product [Vicia faba]
MTHNKTITVQIIGRLNNPFSFSVSEIERAYTNNCRATQATQQPPVLFPVVTPSAINPHTTYKPLCEPRPSATEAQQRTTIELLQLPHVHTDIHFRTASLRLYSLYAHASTNLKSQPSKRPDSVTTENRERRRSKRLEKKKKKDRVLRGDKI